MKKAQAAMEFLMTYGWAILVVLIAIGALAYFGVLSPEKFLPEKCVISIGSGLFCDDFTASSTDDNIKVLIKNILTEKVTVSKVSTNNPVCSDTTAKDILADETTEFTLSCAAGLDPRDKIKADLAIEYQEETSTLKKTTSGSIVTSVA